MKHIFFAVTLLTAITPVMRAQSSIIMSVSSGVKNQELQSILYFEKINFEKFKFNGPLRGKNFKISITEFRNGRAVMTDTVFNSNEDEYFRLKGDSLQFNVLTQVNDKDQFKIEFQFNGFSSSRKYSLTSNERDKFTLKDFLGGQKQKEIVSGSKNYILAYMLPYVRKDKSEAYCEVSQSGIDPEKLFEKYAIPHYYLVAIDFK